MLLREILFYPLQITCPLLENEQLDSSYQVFVGPFSESKALVEAAGYGSWLWKLPLFHDAALWYRRGLNINIPATRIAPHRWWQHSTSALTEEETQMIQAMMMTWVATVGNNFCKRSIRTKKNWGVRGLRPFAPARFVHPKKIHWILSHDIIPPVNKIKKTTSTPPKTNVFPLKGSSSNHYFSSDMLVFGDLLNSSRSSMFAVVLFFCSFVFEPTKISQALMLWGGV